MATVAEWITWAAERGTTIADDADSAAALVRATDHIEAHYLNRVSRTPPDDVTDKAIYIAAAHELATPGFWSKIYTPDQQKVLTGVGDIRWTVRGDASGADAATPVSTMIEGLMRPYMVRGVGMFVV